MPEKTLLDVLKERGVPMPDKVWDYHIFAPRSIDDLAEITVRWQEVIDDGTEFGKPGKWNQATVIII